MKTTNTIGMALGVALGATCVVSAATPAAQVYDVCLSLRTTGAAIGKANYKTNPFLGEDMEEIVYRKPTNVEWRGLIWGCSCEAIDGVWEEVNEVLESGYSSIKGCILWDTQTKTPVYIGNGSDFVDLYSAQGTGFGWDFINAIGRDGASVEGAWTMRQYGQACEEDVDLYVLRGAGFGKLNYNEDCTSYVSYMVGKVSGYMKAPTAEIAANWYGCTFCGYSMEAGSCEFATAWEWGCFWDSESRMSAYDDGRTAVHGTWTVKYNEELSRALCQPVKVTDKGISGFIVSIRDIYNFSELSLVATTIAAIENTFWGVDPTGCAELCEKLVAAKKVVAEKEAALDAVSYENLKAAEAKAAVEVKAAANNVDNAVAAYNAANVTCVASKADYVAQMDCTTNSTWGIAYINRSGDETEISSETTGKKTLMAFAAANEELKGFTLTGANYDGVPFDQPTTYAQLAKFVMDMNDKTAALKAKMEADAANLATAATDVTAAKKAYVEAQDALMAAQNDLANSTLLQLKAWNDLEKAQALEAAAQKAYDDAGCND